MAPKRLVVSAELDAVEDESVESGHMAEVAVKRQQAAPWSSAHALEFYSALWAPYPFPQMTLQDGPSAGMEYPCVCG